jgi:hypothetical protein
VTVFTSRSRATTRIGVGAGFSGDRLDPAQALVQRGVLDYLVFECLAERTIALAQLALLEGTGSGYDPLLLERMRAVLPTARQRGTVLVTNAGAAAPVAAAMAVRDLGLSLGQDGIRVAAVTGDDVLAELDLRATRLSTGPGTLWDIRDRIVSANAYLGADGIVEALREEVDVVVTGRTSDAALFLGPLTHALGWKIEDLPRVAGGTLVGHLLECAGQLTGGYFADGGRKTVPGLARLGFPFADVASDGSAVLRKLPGTGGRLDRQTCLEQLLYEVHDPAAYLTPDVELDVRDVVLHESGPDEVTVSGAVGRPPPATLKVLVAVRDGEIGQGEISYAGSGCLARARLAAAVVADRWVEVHRRDRSELRTDLLGYNGCRPWLSDGPEEPAEVRLRISVRTLTEGVARLLVREVEALYTNGPAGGGGVTGSVRRSLGIVPTEIARDVAEPRVQVLSS